MSKTLTNDEFIEKARKIHGNKYDYSLVEYTGSLNKIEIICPEHGTFKQRTINHLLGRGCHKCGGSIKSNTIDFVKKSKKIHGDKYDYSLVDYVNSITNIKIICQKHGSFYQTPTSHLNQQGCPKCGGSMKSSTIDFVEKSKKIHGDKYDYSLVNYINTNTNVEIICNIHGSFLQTPHIHLNGSGCSKCSEKYNYNTFEIIDEFKKIHGDKYDYSLVNYINCKTKLKIICNVHGVFLQSSNHHKKGVGCPKCSNQGDNRFLYIFYDKLLNLYKIGVSVYPEKRLKDICVNNENNLILVNKYEKCAFLEKKIHKKYAQYNIEHPFYMDGKNEWFKLSKNEINDINKYIKSQK